MKRLLILGGTGEAAALAELAQQRFGDRLEVISSLAGRTREPSPLPGSVRAGGFGGAGGLARYLEEKCIDLLVDATHPYASRMSANARVACEAMGVPRIMLSRPPWTIGPGDHWIPVADATDAARRVPEVGSRAFVAMGSGHASAFGDISGVFLLLRLAEEPEAPPVPGAAWIVGRGPFRESDEFRLLRDWRIDVVVCRNSGGTATRGKIDAARKLAIPVIMIRRPAPEPGRCTHELKEIVAWIAEKLV